MSYDFKFGDLWLSSFGGVTTKKPAREIAQYDFSLIDTAGKSGSDYIDNHRYKNVQFTREVGLNFRRSGKIDQLPDRLIDWLAYSQGYQDHEDTLHPNMVTKAALMNFPEIVTVLNNRYNTASLKFSRVPFWYWKDSLVLQEYTPADVVSGVSFLNPYKMHSEPLIELDILSTETADATIEYSIITGGVTSNYSVTVPVNNSHVLFIDCENQEVRSGSGSGVKFVDATIPKGFLTGTSTFKINTGGNKLESVKIAPRWRSL